MEGKSRVSEEHPSFHLLSKMLASCLLQKDNFPENHLKQIQLSLQTPTTTTRTDPHHTLTASTGFRWCRTNGFEVGLATGKPQEREVIFLLDF